MNMQVNKMIGRQTAFRCPYMQPQSVPCQRIVKRYADDKPQQQQGGIDFTPKTGNLPQAEVFLQKETGFLKEDSAGQPNIFAVETKTFLAGSSKDQGTMSGANAAIAGIAAAVAALAIVGGIFLTKDKGDAPVVEKVGDVPSESLSGISKRIGPVKEAVKEAPAAAQDAAESAPGAVKDAVEQSPAGDILS